MKKKNYINPLERILVIRLSSIGDIVITTPVLRNLRELLPHSKITYLTRKEYAPMLLHNPYIDGIIALELSQMKWEKYIGFAMSLRSERFSMVIDLHNNIRSRILSAILNVPLSYHVPKPYWKRWRLIHHAGSFTPKSLDILDQYLSTLKEAGFQVKTFFPEIFVTESEKAACLNQLEPFIGKQFVGIHPYAKWKNKEWGIEKYLDVAQLLSSEGYNVLFWDSPHARAPELKYLCTDDLRELIGYLSICNLFVGNDSGPAHIAAALGVPTLTIFGPTHPVLGFTPRGRTNVKVLHSGIPCSPCSKHGENHCKYQTLRCMDAVKPEQVFKEALDLLRKND
ncbi:glycosyltransferase family 9 protein [bacterium]|nr:glycosyltransferase family 9 protein [bacterium]